MKTLMEKWISVKSKTKPKKGAKCLVVQNPKTTATREPLFAIFDGKYFVPPEPTIFADFSYGQSRWVDITHWYPLSSITMPIQK